MFHRTSPAGALFEFTVTGRNLAIWWYDWQHQITKKLTTASKGLTKQNAMYNATYFGVKPGCEKEIKVL
jgi:hypothetical protein